MENYKAKFVGSHCQSPSDSQFGLYQHEISLCTVVSKSKNWKIILSGDVDMDDVN